MDNGISLDSGSLVVIGILISALVGALTKIFHMLIASKDKEVQATKDQLKAYEGIVADSLYIATQANNARRQAQGQPNLEVLAAVVPEHSSPTTEAQQRAADLATVRAALTALTVDLDLPPRITAEQERDRAEWTEQNRQISKQITAIQEGQEQLRELTTEVDETADRVDETTQRIEDQVSDHDDD